MVGNGARPYDVSRFIVKYRLFVILICMVVLVQIFLALRLVVLVGNWDESDGKGPRLFNKWTGGSSRNTPDAIINNEETQRTHRKSSHNTAKENEQSEKTVTESQQVSSPATLDLNSLTFIPECNISSKEAVSAIQRAKTQACKEQLAKTACKIIDDSLYLKRLPRRCLNNSTTYGNYVGCFKDEKKKRILPDYFVILKDSNSPKNCVDLCLQSGFQYAGVQYSVECFCGNTKPSSSLELLPSECNMKCPTSESSNWIHTNCGGYFTMNIFETGVFIGYDGKAPVVGLEDFGQNDNNVQHKTPVRVVFFLTLNGRALRQVFRLIKALFHEQHYFYIHVDSRQDYLYRELLILSHRLPNNVRFMVNRRATIWGGASLLTVLTDGMRDLTLHSHEWKWDWDYVINLSESDFPLKPTEKLEYFLRQNNGKNFLKSHGRDVQKFIQKQGLDKTFDECEYRMWRMGDRRLPAGILMDGGSDWIALHRDFVEYVVRSDDELVTGLKTVFKYTLLPAESFFHTLLRNSELCETFVDNNLHVTNWKRKLGCKCQYRNVVDWCGCSPNDFRLADWNRLQLTEPRLLFFGRKFESIVNQGIVNQLESWLYPERFEKNYPTLDQFWLSLYHHHDLSPQPDDILVTLGRSLSRIASQSFTPKFLISDENTISSEHAEVSSYEVKLLEMTAYNREDQLEGILIRFQTHLIDNNGDELSLHVESWFKSEIKIELTPWNQRIAKYRTKLREIRVGGDYDQKEQIFRNFGRALGPFSEPTLAYSVFTNESFNVSFLWIDPNETVQSATNVTLTDGTTANFIKPSLKSPLLPGNWTVKILTADQDILYVITFAIFPLDVYKGKTMPPSQQRLVNGEDSENLENWIDGLVSSYYVVQDFCLEKEVNYMTWSRWSHKAGNLEKVAFNKGDANKYQNSLEALETSLCSHTQWSSLYPDPKSTILGIHPQTRLLTP